MSGYAEKWVKTEFEIWDKRSANIMQFARFSEALRALRDLVDHNGQDVLLGLSLEAVSEDGEQQMTLAEELDLFDLIGAPAKSAGRR